MGKIRIIGGIHRSRQLIVLDSNGLRPTLDRVKETLFNWLGQDLTGLTCLDLFAGSGSLGFEAISRNAKSVTMVEKDRKISQNLLENKKILHADNCQIINIDACEFLKNNKNKYDVIFIDPPYDANLLPQIMTLVSNVVHENSLIYVEDNSKLDFHNFKIKKTGTAGMVFYALLECIG